MRVIVCGGRDYRDRQHVFSVLDRIHALMGPISAIAEGGALGADALARYWASARGVPCETFRAEWAKHGRAAGPLRNQRMLDEFRPDLVVAFPGGRGTADMRRRAEEAGVKVDSWNRA